MVIFVNTSNLAKYMLSKTCIRYNNLYYSNSVKESIFQLNNLRWNRRANQILGTDFLNKLQEHQQINIQYKDQFINMLYMRRSTDINIAFISFILNNISFACSTQSSYSITYNKKHHIPIALYCYYELESRKLTSTYVNFIKSMYSNFYQDDDTGVLLKLLELSQ